MSVHAAPKIGHFSPFFQFFGAFRAEKLVKLHTFWPKYKFPDAEMLILNVRREFNIYERLDIEMYIRYIVYNTNDTCISESLNGGAPLRRGSLIYQI